MSKAKEIVKNIGSIIKIKEREIRKVVYRLYRFVHSKEPLPNNPDIELKKNEIDVSRALKPIKIGISQILSILEEYDSELEPIKEKIINEFCKLTDGVDSDRAKFFNKTMNRLKDASEIEVFEMTDNRITDNKLHKVVESGKIKNVEKFLAEFPNLNINDARDIKGRTALHIAAKRGDVEIINLLMNEDAEVDVQDENERTPLHVAVLNGKADAIKILLEHGADANRKGYGVELKRAGNHNDGQHFHPPLLNLLDLCANQHYDSSYNIEDNFEAYVEAAHVLINGGAKVDIGFYGGHNSSHAIHYATHAGFFSVVEKILERAPSIVNEREELDEVDGWDTPLEIAIGRGDTKMIMLLIEKGANVHDQNIMQQLKKLDNEKILQKAIHKEQEIKDFLKEFDFILTEQKLPESCDINKFSSWFDKLGNSRSQLQRTYVKDFVDKILTQEKDINVNAQDIVSKVKEITSGVLKAGASVSGIERLEIEPEPSTSRTRKSSVSRV